MPPAERSDQNSTISSSLVGGVVPGIERQPRQKLEPSPERLLAMLPNAVRFERYCGDVLCFSGLETR